MFQKYSYYAVHIYINQSSLLLPSSFIHEHFFILHYIHFSTLSSVWIQLSLSLCILFILSFTIGSNLTHKSSQVSEEKERKERTKPNHAFQNWASGLSCRLQPSRDVLASPWTTTHRIISHWEHWSGSPTSLPVSPISVSSCMEGVVCM